MPPKMQCNQHPIFYAAVETTQIYNLCSKHTIL